jgi:hypothetical protein
MLILGVDKWVMVTCHRAQAIGARRSCLGTLSFRAPRV